MAAHLSELPQLGLVAAAIVPNPPERSGQHGQPAAEAELACSEAVDLWALMTALRGSPDRHVSIVNALVANVVDEPGRHGGRATGASF